MAIFIGVLALLMLVLAITGIVRRANPMKAHCFKRNPKLLEQADELLAILYIRINLSFIPTGLLQMQKI